MEPQLIQNKICEIRLHKVMLDFDLAQLYGVETRVLKQAVKRNIHRFPSDFMFVLTEKEADDLVSQFVIPSKSHMGGAFPLAFTEQGIAMLSSVLRSEKAIEVNIAIMRAFVILRQYAMGYAELNQKLENFMVETNTQFSDIYQALIQFAEQKKEQEKPRKRIGFAIGNDNP